MMLMAFHIAALLGLGLIANLKWTGNIAWLFRLGYGALTLWAAVIVAMDFVQ